MKKKMIFVGLFLLAIIGALALFLSSIQTTRAPQAQADVKELRERIRHLEELTAILEKKLSEKRDVKHATFTPDGKLLVTQDDKSTRIWDLHDGKGPATVIPAPAQPAPGVDSPAAPIPPGTSIPPGWKAREFNGMTYYVVPLALESNR